MLDEQTFYLGKLLDYYVDQQTNGFISEERMESLMDDASLLSAKQLKAKWKRLKDKPKCA